MLQHLLGLLGPDLGQLLVAALLAGCLTSLGVEAVVPPPEARGVVADEALVVEVVMVGTGPEGKDAAQTPGEVKAAVGINGLEETEDDPQIHGHQVQLARERNPDDGRANNAEAQEHDLDRGGVLGGETEGRAVGVVQLVDRLVERAIVQPAVEPVVPRILDDEEDDDLHRYLPSGRERDAVVQAEVGRNGVEQPNLGKLNGAVAEKNEPSALPLLLPCRYLGLDGGQSRRERYIAGRRTDVLNLVLVEVGNGVDDHPGNRAAKVDNFVHEEAHDSGRNRVILHPEIPGLWLKLGRLFARRGSRGGVRTAQRRSATFS